MFVGTGERAASVAEKFTFDEIFAEGGEGDWDIGLVGAGGVAVDGSGDKFFSGTAFTGDKNRNISLCGEGDTFEDFLHGGRAADQKRRRCGFSSRAHGNAGGDAIECMSDGLQDLIEIEGFGEVFGDVGLIGFHGGGEVAEGGDQDDGNITLDFLEASNPFETVHTWEPDIEHDDIGRILDDAKKGVFHGREGADTEAFGLKELLEAPTDGGFIIDDNHVGHNLAIVEGFLKFNQSGGVGQSFSSGRIKKNSVWFSTRCHPTSPWRISAAFATRVKPSPTPSALVVTSGSNMDVAISAEGPGPLSRTAMCKWGSWMNADKRMVP